MIAKLEELKGKYYKTEILIKENDKTIGVIHIVIEPVKYSLDEISPREAQRFETDETQEIDWNHIESRSSFEIATKIVEIINNE